MSPSAPPPEDLADKVERLEAELEALSWGIVNHQADSGEGPCKECQHWQSGSYNHRDGCTVEDPGDCPVFESVMEFAEARNA